MDYHSVEAVTGERGLRQRDIHRKAFPVISLAPHAVDFKTHLALSGNACQCSQAMFFGSAITLANEGGQLLSDDFMAGITKQVLRALVEDHDIAVVIGTYDGFIGDLQQSNVTINLPYQPFADSS